MNTRTLWITAICMVVGLWLSPFVGTASAQSVLIDNYYSSWVSGYVEALKSEVEAAGYTVDFNTSSISSATLSGYDVYVLFFPGQSRQISAAEAETIANWVEDGHGLWLGGSMGDTDTTDSCNAVSTRWGVTFNSDALSDTITDITHDHPVTDGANPPTTQVDAFGMYMGCSLSLTSGLSLARCDGQPVMAVVEPGAGRVVLIGDSVNNGPFDDDRLYSYDNLDLALNTVAYTAVPEPVTLSLLAVGAIALIRRRRK